MVAQPDSEPRSITDRWADAEQPGAAEVLEPPIGGVVADRSPFGEEPGEFAGGYPPRAYEDD